MYHRPFLIGALFNCVETVLEIKCNYSLAVNFFIVYDYPHDVRL